MNVNKVNYQSKHCEVAKVYRKEDGVIYTYKNQV